MKMRYSPSKYYHTVQLLQPNSHGGTSWNSATTEHDTYEDALISLGLFRQMSERTYGMTTQNCIILEGKNYS